MEIVRSKSRPHYKPCEIVMSQAASEAPIMGQRVAYRTVLLWNKQNSLIRVLVSKE